MPTSTDSQFSPILALDEAPARRLGFGSSHWGAAEDPEQAMRKHLRENLSATAVERSPDALTTIASSVPDAEGNSDAV
jgi:hypothetical protein